MATKAITSWGCIAPTDDAELVRYYRSIIHALVYSSPAAKLRISEFDWTNSWENYELECVNDGGCLVLSVIHKERHDHKAAFDALMRRTINPSAAEDK